MKENNYFKPIKAEVEKKKAAAEIKPLTADEHDETELKPMSLKDHWLSLRQSIQEKLVVEKPTPDEQNMIKLLSELITPNLLAEYNRILKNFNEKTKKSASHPQREFIDLNNEELATAIENWIENLINQVKDKKETGLNEADTEELRTQCHLLFDAIGNVMNTKSLEKDIVDFYKDKIPDETTEKEQRKQQVILVKELRNRYPLEKTEIKILIDLVRSEKGGGESYSPKILIETITRLWREYNLSEQKGAIAKISLGHLMSRCMTSFAPSLFQGIIAKGDEKVLGFAPLKPGDFNWSVFMEYLGLNMISTAIDTKIEIELAKVMNEINHQINERITNSLFFQEFEFIHEKSLGEIYAALEQGKRAAAQILQDTISKFAPTLAGIVMSLAFLTKINPALGAIGVGSLPIMYKVAKKQNEKISPMYEKERREGEKIATRLGSIKSGFEEIKTSPETPLIATHVKAQMDIKDKLSLQRFIEESKMRLMSMIPFDVSALIAAGVGGALQAVGMISGGEVLSNIQYSSQLNRPIQDLVDLYFNKFSAISKTLSEWINFWGNTKNWIYPKVKKKKTGCQFLDWKILISPLKICGIKIFYEALTWRLSKANY